MKTKKDGREHRLEAVDGELKGNFGVSRAASTTREKNYILADLFVERNDPLFSHSGSFPKQE